MDPGPHHFLEHTVAVTPDFDIGSISVLQGVEDHPVSTVVTPQLNQRWATALLKDLWTFAY